MPGFFPRAENLDFPGPGSGPGWQIRGMAPAMNPSPSETDLIERVRTGDPAALGQAFAHYRDRLRRMVVIRLDRRLQGRVDPSDVLQEAHLDAARRLGDYAREAKVPPFLWLRTVVGDRLVKLHRQHLGAQMRDPGREVSLFRDALPAASSAALAAQLLGKHTSPTEAAVRAERMLRVQDALNALDPIDREILALRHFEGLSRSEAAEALGIEEAAAAKRHVRALARLKSVLAGMPGGLDGL